MLMIEVKKNRLVEKKTFFSFKFRADGQELRFSDLKGLKCLER